MSTEEKPKSSRIEIRIASDLVKKLDRWRGAQEDVPNRSEAARRLMMKGMEDTGAGSAQL